MEIPTGTDLAARAQRGECLRCGLPGMRTDDDTGFPEHYCVLCAPLVDAERLKRDRERKERPRDRRARHEAGIANLTRLLGD